MEEQHAAPDPSTSEDNNIVEPTTSQRTINFRLPEFWPDNAISWFAMAECQFHLRAVESEKDKFCLLVAALSRDSIRLVTNLVENPPMTDPYTQTKRSLLSSHTLTDFQRVELLHQAEPLGSRKPTELLAAMMEICPRGHEASLFFTYLFIQRLPRDIRMLLAEDDHSNLRKLAEKADRLVALAARQHHDSATTASIPPPAEEIAAMNHFRRGDKDRANHGPRNGSKPENKFQKNHNHRREDHGGLCFYHNRFGPKANSCNAPCTWMGN